VTGDRIVGAIHELPQGEEKRGCSPLMGITLFPSPLMGEGRGEGERVK